MKSRIYKYPQYQIYIYPLPPLPPIPLLISELNILPGGEIGVIDPGPGGPGLGVEGLPKQQARRVPGQGV